MGPSAIHEFAKIASVDSVYEVYEMADKLGGYRPPHQPRRRDVVVTREELNKRLARENASQPTKPSKKVVAPTQAAAPEVAAPAPAPAAAARKPGQSGVMTTRADAKKRLETRIAARRAARAASAAPVASEVAHAAAPAAAHAAAEAAPGALRRAAQAIMANKGKAALGLGAAGLGAYGVSRFNRRGE